MIKYMIAYVKTQPVIVWIEKAATPDILGLKQTKVLN